MELKLSSTQVEVGVELELSLAINSTNLFALLIKSDNERKRARKFVLGSEEI